MPIDTPAQPGIRVMRQVLEVEGPLPASAFAGSAILSAEELTELEALLNAEEPQQ